MAEKNEDIEVAFEAFAQGKYGDSFSKLRQAADDGDLNALLAVGWMREYGVGINRDAREAVDCYRQATALGSLEAVSRLGHILMSEGRFDEAKIALESGVSRGHASSEYRLGCLLLRDCANENDRERGKALIKRAAEHGQIFAKRKWWSFQWQESHSILSKISLLIEFVPLSLSAFWTLLRDSNSEKVI